MQINNLSVFRIGKEKMRFLSERQAVLALNISNADTQGYKARDLREPQFHAMAFPPTQPVALARTDASHLPSMQRTGGFKTVLRNPHSERNPNDNEVNIDEEIQRVSQTQMEYNKVVSIYRKNITLYKMALGNPNAS